MLLMRDLFYTGRHSIGKMWSETFISCTLVNNHHFDGLAGLAKTAHLRRPTWRISVERKRTTLDSTGTYGDFWKRSIVSSALNWVFWKLRCRTGGQCGVVLDECLHSVLSRSAIVPVLWWLIRSHLFYTCILDTKSLPWFAFVFVECYQRSIRVCHRAWNQKPSSKIMYFRTRSADTTMHTRAKIKTCRHYRSRLCKTGDSLLTTTKLVQLRSAKVQNAKHSSKTTTLVAGSAT